VLDPGLLSVLRVVSDISNGVDVIPTLDPKVAIDVDASVLFDLEAGVLEQVRVGLGSDAEDDGVAREGGAVLELR
jgi:hypothetical protein